jgi:methenyltetrahydromethanopterin cyclohydrolase
MTSLNERAWIEFEGTLAGAEALGIAVHQLPGGMRLLDAGVSAPGGLEAGLAMARIGMSGLGQPDVVLDRVGAGPWPWITVRSDRPMEACFLSQAAHWPVEIGAFRAMGSGPACLLNRDLQVGKAFDYAETSDCAVLVLEASTLPDESTCRTLAEKCAVAPERLALVVAPTSSLAGSAQIAARSLETGLHKLHQMGFDLRKMVSGMGRCPAAAPTGSDLMSLGKTNDMVLFGSQVWLSLRGVSDADLANLAPRVPAATSPSYGEPFLQTLKNAGGFYAIDPGLFAPAEVTLVNLDSGAICHAGSIDRVRLEKALGV